MANSQNTDTVFAELTKKGAKRGANQPPLQGRCDSEGPLHLQLPASRLRRFKPRTLTDNHETAIGHK